MYITKLQSIQKYFDQHDVTYSQDLKHTHYYITQCCLVQTPVQNTQKK